MNLSDYQQLYDAVLGLSFDMDGVRIFTGTTEDDIEKCKIVAAILEVLNDVPKAKTEIMFKHRKIKFNYIEFIDDLTNKNFN